MKLAVAALHSHLKPTVDFEHIDQLLNLHRKSLPQSAQRGRGIALLLGMFDYATFHLRQEYGVAKLQYGRASRAVFALEAAPNGDQHDTLQ